MPVAIAPVLAALAAKGDAKVRADMAPRYGITAEKAWGVRMADIKLIARGQGRNHALAEPLWATGWYEARLLVSMIADPALLTAAQMDRWTRDFDNWAVCDTLCFNLYDRSPHAWAKVDKWATAKPEFVKRTAFALLASLALHDKKAPDEPFLARLPLIEAAASDERNFVTKGVNWALRSIGNRKSPALKKAAFDLAARLAASSDPTARWNGKDALREFKRKGTA
jgi:3-methyladenine DNA glycosylase AlkD